MAAKCEHRGGIPENFEFQLLPDNWDAFQILLDNAMIRVPALETAQVKQFYNGPESFTADNNFIVGPAPGFDNFYVGCGFNSMGIASAGGAGRALAEWIMQGEPTLDLWPVDIRRFDHFNANENWLPDRIGEVLGMHYKMPWPNRELESARPFRRSPLYSLLRDAGACFGSKMGWERANFSRRPANRRRSSTRGAIRTGIAGSPANTGRAASGCHVRHELLREAADQGAGCAAALNSIVANEVPVEPGATVYTGMLNDRGGYESDFTVTMLDHSEYMIVTGSAQAVRDRDMIERAFAALPDPPRCEVIDITSMYAVIAVMGPRSRQLLQRVSTARSFARRVFPSGHRSRSTSAMRRCVQRASPTSASSDGSFTFRSSSRSASTKH